MAEYWKGDFEKVQVWFLLAEDPDLATVLKRAKPDLDEAASVYVRMKDQKEVVLIEGGQAFEIQRTGQDNELGEEILVLSQAAPPIEISDDLIAERRRVNVIGKEFLRSAAEGKMKFYAGPTAPFPEVVDRYLQKPLDEQRQWIAVEATTEEWNEFINALRAMPEDDQNFVWSLYVLRPHKDVVDRRHPNKPPRGAA
jgi:hypothetical protein